MENGKLENGKLENLKKMEIIIPKPNLKPNKLIINNIKKNEKK